ncbi:hypothetical protein GCM10011352_24060 [Marinobacterium zhoushanense]|uniref:Zinc-finger domain-containing protein n=1 Tax=Marinobacterium zhoushanense TaxID=1679163 RepID=A0ABQ1KIT8_9GAMM|nr:hypothetical protein [Marinobacterium zhoushanense]GGB97103.1 hypothetical protein GCM10011352_24060 [Marinobacterium zhoushanense]
MTDSNHDENLMALLPWYVNGTLTEDERQAVEALLQRSAEARATLETLQTLQTDIKAELQEPVPGDLGWKRLQKSIHSQPTPIPKTQRDRPIWNRFLAAAAVLIIALQVGLLLKTPTDTTPQLLGTKPGTEQLQDAQLYRLVIAPDARWSEVEALLLELNAQLVDGPSAVGVVSVAIKAPADQAETVLEQLNSHPAIEHAQAVRNE